MEIQNLMEVKYHHQHLIPQLVPWYKDVRRLKNVKKVELYLINWWSTLSPAKKKWFGGQYSIFMMYGAPFSSHHLVLPTDSISIGRGLLHIVTSALDKKLQIKKIFFSSKRWKSPPTTEEFQAERKTYWNRSRFCHKYIGTWFYQISHFYQILWLKMLKNLQLEYMCFWRGIKMEEGERKKKKVMTGSVGRPEVYFKWHQNCVPVEMLVKLWNQLKWGGGAGNRNSRN